MAAAVRWSARAGLVGGALAASVLLAWAPGASAALKPRATVADLSVLEGRKAVFVVKLNRAPRTAVRVRFKTRNGAALAGVDYKARSGVLRFKARQRTRRVAVVTLNDGAWEPTEGFFLRLSAPRGVVLRRATARTRIKDDDPLPALSVADVTVEEGNGGQAPASFAVILTGATSKTVTVAYETSDGSALAGSDYTAAAGTLTFLPGETVKQVDVPVHGDVVDEDAEDFTLTLSSPAGATLADATATGTIEDDDDAVADVGITVEDDPDPIVAGALVTYTALVTNAGPDRAPATVVVDDLPAGLSYVSASATSGSCSYTAPRVTCSLGTIPSGEARTVTVVAEPVADGVLANTLSASGDYADANAANDAATAETSVAQGADLAVTLGESGDPVLSGEELTYSLTAANRGPFPAADPVLTQTLSPDVAFVSASPGCSFADGVVTCGAGALGASLAPGASVPLEVVVTRTAAEEATFDSTAAIAGSAPSDPDPDDNAASVSTTYLPAGDLRLELDGTPGPLDEGESLVWTVTLENLGPNDAASAALVQSLPSGFALGTVTTSHGLCVPSPGSLDCTFGTLAPATTVTVVVSGTTAAGSVGTTLATAATATSTTADPTPADNTASDSVKVQPTVSVADVTVVEPKGLFPAAGTPRTVLARFTVTLSRPSPQTITMSWATANGTATAGSDYHANGGPLGFPPGTTTMEAGVTVTSDGSSDLPEPNEIFYVNLTNAVNATPLDAQGVGTIDETP